MPGLARGHNRMPAPTLKATADAGQQTPVVCWVRIGNTWTVIVRRP